MMLIRPYRDSGTWVFDDPGAGLVREPFVAGIPAMIDLLVADIPNASQGFRLIFSAQAFPGAQVRIDWLREDSAGNWYRWEERALEGWLCPALFKYFDQAPKSIWCRAEAL